MKKVVNIYEMYSLKEVILERIRRKYKNKLKQYLYNKLITWYLLLLPKSWSEVPVIELIQLQKGELIGKMVMEIDQVSSAKNNNLSLKLK